MSDRNDPDVEGFLLLLAARCSPRTVDAYRRDLTAFAASLDGPVGEATTEQVEAWLVRSNDGGRKWGTARPLSSQPMQLEWIASSTRGKMIGDYVAVSWAGGNPWAVMPLVTRALHGWLHPEERKI